MNSDGNFITFTFTQLRININNGEENPPASLQQFNKTESILYIVYLFALWVI